tara:strand:+ start:1965 stop:2096 length:132 start_codon:yes stop_codon:yes gene_type:complete
MTIKSAPIDLKICGEVRWRRWRMMALKNIEKNEKMRDRRISFS